MKMKLWVEGLQVTKELHVVVRWQVRIDASLEADLRYIRRGGNPAQDLLYGVGVGLWVFSPSVKGAKAAIYDTDVGEVGVSVMDIGDPSAKGLEFGLVSLGSKLVQRNIAPKGLLKPRVAVSSHQSHSFLAGLDSWLCAFWGFLPEAGFPKDPSYSPHLTILL
jgi:hypothetical protein